MGTNSQQPGQTETLLEMQSSILSNRVGGEQEASAEHLGM